MIGESHRPSGEGWTAPQQTETLPSLHVEALLSDYQTRPLQESFEWAAFIASAAEHKNLPPGHEFYLFAFRSRLKPGADYNELMQLDARVLQEVSSSEHLIFYFSGLPDELGNCISFCLWTDYESARKGSRGPQHQAIMELTTKYYDIHEPERHWVKLSQDGLTVTFNGQPSLN